MVAREVAVTFDGTFDGFLSIVYAHYYDKINPINIQPENHAQLTLVMESVYIETNPTHSAKVFSAIKEKISYESAEFIFNAFLSSEDDRFMALLAYIKMGFVHGQKVDNHLQTECVRRVQKLAKHVAREAHLLNGFCRFAETKQGVFYCKITPKNNVLPIIANHFSQRFNNQAWIIHDQTYGQAAIYNQNSYVITTAPMDAIVDCVDDEEETQELWVTFFNAHFIKARVNLKLQRQMLPLYFRKNMTEFQRM